MDSRTEKARRRASAYRVLGRRLHEASAGLLLLGDRLLAPLGLTATQWKVLAALEAEGPARVADLVRVLRLDQAGTSRLVGRLEEAGFVARRPSSADRREVRVELTEQGRQAAARCREVLGPLMGELTEGLEDEALEALARGLEVLAERIEELATRVPPRRAPRGD